jgi:hypothetical protein
MSGGHVRRCRGRANGAGEVANQNPGTRSYFRRHRRRKRYFGTWGGEVNWYAARSGKQLGATMAEAASESIFAIGDSAADFEFVREADGSCQQVVFHQSGFDVKVARTK